MASSRTVGRGCAARRSGASLRHRHRRLARRGSPVGSA